jgi:hypothetical protein
MPRDEPVGSLGRLALKLTEFREQAEMIDRRPFHRVWPHSDGFGGDPMRIGPDRVGERAGRETKQSVGISLCCRWRG